MLLMNTLITFNYDKSEIKFNEAQIGVQYFWTNTIAILLVMGKIIYTHNIAPSMKSI